MMYLKLNLIFLFLIGFFNSVFPQDKLIKNDGTALEVKIIEISDTEIKYKMFNNPEGPLYIADKSEFVKAEYKNGQTDVFINKIDVTEIKTLPASAIKKENIGDWIKFNIDAGMACSKSFNAIPRELNGVDHHGGGSAYGKNSASNKAGFSPYVGLNFIFGKDKVIKHLLGVSYLNVKTNYNESTGSGYIPESFGATLPPPQYGSSENVSVSGNYHILALYTGLDFKLGKALNLCMTGSVGVTAKGTLVSNGSRINYTTVADSAYPGYRTTSQIVLIENERSNGSTVTFYSLQAKVWYDFKIKENVLGVYLLGNISAINRLPYFTVGLSWYPFKKLRVTDL